MGDLVTVKPGYARNFLLPQGKALRATEANKKRFETDRAQLEAENLARKGEAEQVAAKMEGMSVTLIRAASEMGQLYGSASSRDIADRIIDAGVTITRNQVDLNTAIKTLGLFPIRIVLHPEVSVDVTVNIARSEDEAAEQRRLGRAIISDIAERERAEAAEAAREAADRMAAMEDEDDEETTGSSASAESTDEAADAPAEADADASDETADKAAEENGEETEETKE